jgi:glycosyltransferase involved in cell wall biosynthesis
LKTIGYVLADFPVFSETFVGDEMRAMAKRGHKVVPIVMRLRDGPAQEADILLARDAKTLSSASNEAALRALARPGPDSLSALSYLWKQKHHTRRSLMWNAMKIAAIAREQDCDHLHAHFSGGATAHAIVAARWIGASVSFVCHGHDVYAEAEDLPTKLAAADAVVAVCNDMASDLRNLAPGSNVAMIPCGTDPDAFRPAREAEPMRTLLFVGRLVEQKGIDDLLTALAIQGSASVDIVGDGPLMASLRERAEALKLSDRVRFLGSRPREWLRENAPHYFGLLAPFKIAPDGSRDSGPLVVKEAMAMELPVVATRFMGNKDMIVAGTGFLAEPDCPESLAEAIERMVRLPLRERAEMGRRGRERMIKLFSLDASSEALSRVFEAA